MRHLDCFVFRDKVNRAAGRRAGALFFARHLDYFIMTRNSHPSPGLGTVKTIYRDPKLIVHLPGLAKIAPWWLARRDNFSVKVPGLVTTDSATNAFCSYPLAVRLQCAFIAICPLAPGLFCGAIRTVFLLRDR